MPQPPKPQAVRCLSVFVATLLLSVTACRTQSGDEQDVVGDALLPSQEAVLEKVYRSGGRTTTGFYRDPRDDGITPHTVRHLKDTSGMPALPGFDRCVENADSALGWSQIDAAEHGGNLVGTEQRALYFEFSRTNRHLPGWMDYSRIFRCDFLSRAGIDSNAASGLVGYLNHQPADADALTLVTEYLWTFGPFNNAGHFVVESASENTGTSLQHRIVMAELLPEAGVTPGCDLVRVFEWVVALQNSDGRLTASIHPLWEFEATQSPGQPSEC